MGLNDCEIPSTSGLLNIHEKRLIIMWMGVLLTVGRMVSGSRRED